jgi:heterodisulfide reductase subunit C
VHHGGVALGLSGRGDGQATSGLRLLKAFLDRDSRARRRLHESADDGAFRCHTIFNCIDACPKGLNPTQAIETLRGLAAKRTALEAARRSRQAVWSGAPAP